MTYSEQTAILDLLAELSPIQPEDRDALPAFSSIEIVPGEADSEWSTRFDDRGDLRIILRLICWERSADMLQVRDIKEQPVRIPAPLLTDPARVELFLRAWSEVLSRAFENTDAEIDTLLPVDLFFPGVLKLKRPKTQDQLAAALTVHSRLGKYLP